MILCACVRGTVFMRIVFGLVGSICLGMFKVGIFFFLLIWNILSFGFMNRNRCLVFTDSL